MSSAKEIRLRPIPSKVARPFVAQHHYSGKVVNNSSLHLGVFLHGRLGGVMSFGPPLDKRKIQGLVRGTPWNGLLELNRMAFSEYLPRNSESRALGVAMRLLRAQYPALRFVVSFADATQCGDGAIYRASGFVLTGIKDSMNLARLPDGSVVHKMTLESTPTARRPELGGRSYYDVTGGRFRWKDYVRAAGAEVLVGHQLRYMRFLDPSAQADLKVPIVPFSELAVRGISMYKGEARADEA